MTIGLSCIIYQKSLKNDKRENIKIPDIKNFWLRHDMLDLVFRQLRISAECYGQQSILSKKVKNLNIIFLKEKKHSFKQRFVPLSRPQTLFRIQLFIHSFDLFTIILCQLWPLTLEGRRQQIFLD